MLGPLESVIGAERIFFAGEPPSFGGSLVIRHEFVPARVLDDIEDNGVTFIGVVPLILERMAASPDFGERDLSGLRVAKVGGATVPEHLIRIYTDRGVGLVNANAFAEGSDRWPASSAPAPWCSGTRRFPGA